MGCPVCPVAGWLGGGIGGYFGIQPPAHFEGRMLSAIITANLVSITVIALKALFDISLCARGGSPLGNVARLAGKTLILGIIYSIGTNYLLNRYVFPQLECNQDCDSSSDDPLPNDEIAHACCKCKEEVEGENDIETLAH